MAGRPTKRTPDARDRLIKGLREGAPRVHACWYAGISEDTFARWLKDDADFAGAVKAAEGQAVVSRLLRIQKAGSSGQWQADAWVLERRYPQEYGRRLTEIQGKDGGPIPVHSTADRTPVADARYLAAVLAEFEQIGARGAYPLDPDEDTEEPVHPP